ncbi:MAG: hypothetical protein ACPGVS_10955, partial [Primorskyibacter sp.]
VKYGLYGAEYSATPEGVGPGFIVNDKGEYSAPPEAEQPNPLHRDLSSAEFKGLLAASELDTVWDALQAAVKGVDTAKAKSVRRLLAKSRAQNTFRLDATLSLVAEFREQAAMLVPDVDLSPKIITAEWEEAAGDDA